MVEQLICNHQVAGSIPAAGTILYLFDVKMLLSFVDTMLKWAHN